MALKEQDVVLYSTDADGNKVIQMPITRIENVEGGVKSVNGAFVDANGNVEIAIRDYGLDANTKPANVITAPSSDTVANWQKVGAGAYFFSIHNSLNNQPSQHGFVLNTTYGGDIFQIFKSQRDGDLYYRGGNGDGWGSAWKRIVSITSSWRSGTSWYRKWSDGTIEQGGYSTTNNITFPTAFSNTNYTIVQGQYRNGEQASGSAYYFTGFSTTGCSHGLDSHHSIWWYAIGN